MKLIMRGICTGYILQKIETVYSAFRGEAINVFEQLNSEVAIATNIWVAHVAAAAARGDDPA